MSQTEKDKPYDLEERTFRYARRCFAYYKLLPRTIVNIEVSKQAIRASGSIGSNFIEANEALGRKDFLMRIKICRKEDKENIYWLKLPEPTKEQETERATLIAEGTELMKIFGSIIEKAHR